jgi:aryl-alcohol dehydrogenase-like predicted oxidoreductase
MMALPMKITIGSNSAHPLEVYRLGYGTMRLTGPGIWGEPANHDEALQILRTAVERGVTFLDTADYYGDDVTNRLIKEALYPYQDNLVICTKVGATRKPDKSWIPFNTPENLRTAIDNNLRTLQIEQVQLVHLRMMSHADVPFEDMLGTMFEMQQEGKILHLGLSNVSRTELALGLKMGTIATVENMYGYGQRTTLVGPYGESRGGQEVLDLCEQHQIPFIPYWSLLNSLPKEDDKIAQIARKYGVSEAQINLAWLLHRSPLMLPIPGTSKLAHLEDNLNAVNVTLTEEDMEFLG